MSISCLENSASSKLKLHGFAEPLLHVTVGMFLWFLLHYCWREGSLTTESGPSPHCPSLLVHQTWDLLENPGAASGKHIWLSFPWAGGREGAQLHVWVLFCLSPLVEWGVWTCLRHGPGPGSWSHSILIARHYLGSHLWAALIHLVVV